METTLTVAGLWLCVSVVQCSEVLPTWTGVRKNSPKYILLWNDPSYYPTSAMGDGQSAFIENKCEHTNCFVTSDRNLKDVTDYDAIVFNGRWIPKQVPEKRSPRQKYVYANTESSHNYPVCDTRFNDFFNWTWTYKLNSDAWWGYIRVYDLNGTVVGPRIDMHWSDFDAVDNKTKLIVKNKSVAAAWFVSNCNGLSGRSDFVKATAKELAKYGHKIHIYGRCGDYNCPRSTPEKCDQMVANDYFFYLAFENSFAEDYVTEKVLTGLRNYAVPVVFGDANYSRFLPPGSYLDARELGPEGLAVRMTSIIRNHELRLSDEYYDFFRWRSRYVITSTSPEEYVCNICSDLNNPEKTSRQTVYKNFTHWWNSKHAKCKAGTVIESVVLLIIIQLIHIWC